MNAFQVIHPGVHTAVQDLGRPGFMKYGTPASGVADRFSARAANWLAGNPENAAVLEVTLYRLELLALADVSIAVTGADLTPAVDNRPLPMWETVRVRKGERFLFRGRKKGLRAYVAVEGGFEAPVFLGSRSVFVRGLMGKALEAGEVLAVAKPRDASPLKRKLPGRMIPPFTRDPLRVVLGPQDDRFTAEGIETFLSSSYRVTPQSDRMGYRLDGPRIAHRAGADIISEPIARGAIQVPGDGLPIILLWDAQVSGGYTKIASVISADLDRLAQVMPGESLSFRRTSLEEAHAALREKEKAEEAARLAVLGDARTP